MTPKAKVALAAAAAVLAAGIVYKVVNVSGGRSVAKTCVPHAAAPQGREPVKFPCPGNPQVQCYRDFYGTTVPTCTDVGHSYGVGPAHGTGMCGGDHVLWPLLDQQDVNGNENVYPRPPDEAGAEVQRWHDFYWKGTQSQINRCYFLPPGRDYHEPPTNVQSCCAQPSPGPSPGPTMQPTAPEMTPTSGPANCPTAPPCPCRSPVPTAHTAPPCNTVPPGTPCA